MTVGNWIKWNIVVSISSFNSISIEREFASERPSIDHTISFRILFICYFGGVGGVVGVFVLHIGYVKLVGGVVVGCLAGCVSYGNTVVVVVVVRIVDVFSSSPGTCGGGVVVGGLEAGSVSYKMVRLVVVGTVDAGTSLSGRFGVVVIVVPGWVGTSVVLVLSCSTGAQFAHTPIAQIRINVLRII